MCVVIQIQTGDLTVFFTEDKTVQPEFVILGVGEPTAGLLLLIRNHRPADAVGPDAIAMGNLLSYFHHGAGEDLFAKIILHRWDYSGGGQRSPYERAFINSFHRCDIASGTTRTSPTAVMKLVSPPHRGTTCWWMWPGRPAPAQRPRLMPR